MAELYWSWTQYELPDAAEDVGDVMLACESSLQSLGYEGVAVSADVHGYKPGIDLFAAIVFLEIGSGRTFWQVVAVGGDADEADAQAELAQIEEMIATLVFL